MANSLRKASQLAQLDSLGSSKADFDTEGQLPVLSRIAGEFIKRVQGNIQSAGLNATGKMSKIEIEELPNGINILAAPYLIYHDSGVSGTQKKYNTPFAYTNKMPPVDKIKEWIELKGIQTRNNDKFYEDKSDIAEGAAWAIAKSIQKKGIEPKNIYAKEIPKLVDDIAEGLADYSVNLIFKAL